VRGNFASYQATAQTATIDGGNDRPRKMLHDGIDLVTPGKAPLGRIRVQFLKCLYIGSSGKGLISTAAQNDRSDKKERPYVHT
jgi:hypothetical protein